MNEILELTLVELCKAVRDKKISAVDLMQAVMSAADASHESLNAMTARRDPEALLEDARAADKRIAKGEGRVLEGIPLGVKDLEDAAGLVTTHGSKLFEADPPAARDSIQVERLRAAGAIVFGKTTSPEVGFTAITKSLVHGVTRSPWDSSKSPGGSSGGSAALLAAEVMPLVTGSDGGGSIRIPASFTGAFGLKTSYGRIPMGPRDAWEYLDTSVYGPLTKTVEDGAFFLDVVAGHHALDPKSLPTPTASYLDCVRGELPTGLRIAYSPDLDFGVVDGEVATIAEEAAKVFEKLGHELQSVSGGPPEMGTDWGLLGAYLLGGRYADRIEGREGDVTRSLMNGIRMARGVTATWWAETARKRAELVAWCAKIFERYDALLTPTTPFTAPPAKGPFPTHIDGEQLPPSSAGTFTIPFNLSWHPAASVRAGLTQEGLPVGLQIVAPLHRDDLALQLSRAFERERPWHPLWPLRGSG